MNAGELRHRVDIEKKTKTTGDYNEESVSWSPIVRDLPARVLTVSATEGVVDPGVVSERSINIKIRYYPNITRKCRVKHGSNYYYIQSAFDPEGRGRELLLVCSTEE